MGELLKGKVLFPGTDCILPRPCAEMTSSIYPDLLTSRRRLDTLAARARPLTGEDIDQLKRIMEVVGTPTPELLKKICSEHVSEGAKSPQR